MAKKTDSELKVSPAYSFCFMVENRDFRVEINPKHMSLGLIWEHGGRTPTIIATDIDPCGRSEEAAKEIMGYVDVFFGRRTDGGTKAVSVFKPTESKWMAKMVEALTLCTDEIE